MFKKNIFYYTILVFALLCCDTGYSKPPIFVDSPEDAFALSESIDVNILLVFTASWCPSCDTMKHDLHNNLPIIEDTIVCYIDHDKRQDLVKEYKVRLLPSYFLYRKRVEKRKGSGYQNLSKFKKWLENDNQ